MFGGGVFSLVCGQFWSDVGIYYDSDDGAVGVCVDGGDNGRSDDEPARERPGLNKRAAPRMEECLIEEKVYESGESPSAAKAIETWSGYEGA